MCSEKKTNFLSEMKSEEEDKSLSFSRSWERKKPSEFTHSGLFFIFEYLLLIITTLAAVASCFPYLNYIEIFVRGDVFCARKGKEEETSEEEWNECNG